MSRYLSQLLHLYRPEDISCRILGYGVESRESHPISVRKTPAIMAELKRYQTMENPRYLSASSINQYINCPLSFYLTSIAGYKREDEFHDYMDESTYGTIIHGVLEDLYKAERESLLHGRFNRQAIERLLRHCRNPIQWRLRSDTASVPALSRGRERGRPGYPPGRAK